MDDWCQPLRLLLVASSLAALFGAVACGGVTNRTVRHRTARTAFSDLTVPPIVKLDEVVSPTAWRNMNEVGGSACASAPYWKMESPCPPDFNDEPPEARATTKVYAGLRSPRNDGFIGYVITYRSPHNGACSFLATNLGVGLAGLPDCTAVETCEVDTDCISLTTLQGDELLTTIAPAKARSIRLTFRSGRTAEYALNGPLYPGLSDRRIFMVDLGPERIGLPLGDPWVEVTY
jgi:hypothetical protein